MKRLLIKQAAALLLLVSNGIAVHAAPSVADDLVLADVTACKKPSLPPPPLMQESYERYNIQRRYIDLDGSGTCVLMEVWVERLSGSDSPGMRTIRNRFLHVSGKKWVPFYTDLRLFPFLLRSPRTGETYLVVAPDEDIDVMAAGKLIPQAYVRGNWRTNDSAKAHTYNLLPLGRERSHVFRALAAQLAQRTPLDKQTPADQKRIRSLRFEALDVDKGISPSPPR